MQQHTATHLSRASSKKKKLCFPTVTCEYFSMFCETLPLWRWNRVQLFSRFKIIHYSEKTCEILYLANTFPCRCTSCVYSKHVKHWGGPWFGRRVSDNICVQMNHFLCSWITSYQVSLIVFTLWRQVKKH